MLIGDVGPLIMKMSPDITDDWQVGVMAGGAAVW